MSKFSYCLPEVRKRGSIFAYFLDEVQVTYDEVCGAGKWKGFAD